jgi:hypothetical protein
MNRAFSAAYVICVRGTWGDLPQAGIVAAPVALNPAVTPRV